MDPRRKQLLIGIWMILIAVLAGFLIVQAIRSYSPWKFSADVNEPLVIDDETKKDEVEPAWTDPNSEVKSENDTSVQQEPVEDLKKDPTTVSIIIPNWAYTDEFKLLLQQIEAQENVTTNVRSVATIDEYKKVLRASLQHPEQIDIILVPTNFITSFVPRGYHLSFKESISPLFDSLFRDWVDNSAFTYIPFAIDPMVTFYNTEAYRPSGKTTLSDIQSALLTPRKTTGGYVPLLFGIDAGDVALLEQWATTYPWYLELLQLFLQMDISKKTLTLINYFNQTQYRDTTHFHNLSTAIWEHVLVCKTQPQLCLLVYGMGDIAFGRLHEYTSIQNDFPNPRAQIGMSNFPNIDLGYPVTGRWRVISKWSPNIPGALRWVKGYLQIIVDKEPTLQSDVFSALNAVYQRQRIEDRYLPLAPFMSTFEFIIWSVTDGQKILQKTSLIPMLRWEYSQWIFLKKMVEATE